MGEEEKGEGEEEVYPYGEYIGGRDANLDRHGWGSALLPNGDIYEGYYRHGLRMNKGMYCFRNGARYEGMWRKSRKHGQGEMIYPDGSKYVGEWRKDLKNGQGTYFYINGDTYEGAWFKGQRHGLGTYTYKKVNVSHFGTWKDGRMEGPGVLSYGPYRYHGIFDRNLPKGPGCFVFQNKWMQHGFYVNIRDPAFDYVGAEDLELNQREAEEDRSNPRGIVPLWRARLVTAYDPELMPPEPIPVPVKQSMDSLLDIIDYLERHYGEQDGEEEEGGAPPPAPPSPEQHQEAAPAPAPPT